MRAHELVSYGDGFVAYELRFGTRGIKFQRLFPPRPRPFDGGGASLTKGNVTYHSGTLIQLPFRMQMSDYNSPTPPPRPPEKKLLDNL